MKKKILIIDDDAKIRLMYEKYLTKEGYQVITADNGENGLKIFYAEKDVDLVLLDIMMPGKDGYEVCKELKSTNNIPIIMLTAKDSNEDELEGLECGADDYISKLASLKIIAARIDLILKRWNVVDEDSLEYGGVKLDFVAHKLYVDNQEVEISLKEFELLAYLMKNKDRALTRESLLKNVWDYDYYEDSRTLDTHIKKLRKRLGKDKDYIKTVWGVGYKFEID